MFVWGTYLFIDVLLCIGLMRNLLSSSSFITNTTGHDSFVQTENGKTMSDYAVHISRTGRLPPIADSEDARPAGTGAMLRYGEFLREAAEPPAIREEDTSTRFVMTRDRGFAML